MRVFGDDRYSGRRKDKYGSSNRSDRPQMYDAVCDKCGRDCKVPFKPSNDKPIYCSSCFEEQGGGNSDRSRGRDNRGGRRDYGNSKSNYRNNDRGDREMFSAICDDCGKECKVPFKPSSDKPIYCSECFEKRGGGNDKGGNGGNSKQLEEINEKLDILLRLLEGKAKKEEKVKPEEKVEKVIKAKKKVKKEKLDKKKLEEVINEEIEEEKEKTMDVVEDILEE